MATVGRKKRKRKKGSGTAVKVGSHIRSPRGPNRGKKSVRVDTYKRAKTKKGGIGRVAKRRKRRKS